ncbi:porin [Escherichia coli]|nr:porin [Escherichia coli]
MHPQFLVWCLTFGAQFNVDYIINQIDSDNKLGVGSDDTVAVGIVYQF